MKTGLVQYLDPHYDHFGIQCGSKHQAFPEWLDAILDFDIKKTDVFGMIKMAYKPLARTASYGNNFFVKWGSEI